jgi:hypothetical protein
VKIRPLRDLVNESVCVGVLRRPDVWGAPRVATLLEFVEGLESAGAKYNYEGVWRFLEKKTEHQDGLTRALEQFFEQEEAGTAQRAAAGPAPFFCSELVVASLIHIGYIHPSAAVIYNPGTQSPGDLLRDPTYGYLVGVLAPAPRLQAALRRPSALARQVRTVRAAVNAASSTGFALD